MALIELIRWNRYPDRLTWKQQSLNWLHTVPCKTSINSSDSAADIVWVSWISWSVRRQQVSQWLKIRWKYWWYRRLVPYRYKTKDGNDADLRSRQKFLDFFYWKQKATHPIQNFKHQFCRILTLRMRWSPHMARWAWECTQWPHPEDPLWNSCMPLEQPPLSAIKFILSNCRYRYLSRNKNTISLSKKRLQYTGTVRVTVPLAVKIWKSCRG
jgi:hypothetical protein